jgi:hypothetical protein
LLTTTLDDDDGAYAFGNPIWGTKHFIYWPCLRRQGYCV